MGGYFDRIKIIHWQKFGVTITQLPNYYKCKNKIDNVDID